MKNSHKIPLKWKSIIVVDVNKKPLKIYQLDDDERLSNPLSRPKKRTSLYKKYNDQKIVHTEKKEKKKVLSLTMFEQVIFSTEGTNKNDISINTDFKNTNEINETYENTEIDTDVNDEKVNQFQYFSLKNIFDESNSDELTVPSDFEMQ